MPPSERDVEIARSLFRSKGDITSYIVRLGVRVENTTKSEIDKTSRRRPASGLQDEGGERQADRHEVQPE